MLIFTQPAVGVRLQLRILSNCQNSLLSEETHHVRQPLNTLPLFTRRISSDSRNVLIDESISDIACCAFSPFKPATELGSRANRNSDGVASVPFVLKRDDQLV
ncbi:MAG: hypothetical protein AB8B97_16845 [Granulosicoccus sp.]